MAKHNLEIRNYGVTAAVLIACRSCQNPEPPTVAYVWQRANNDVYFDGGTTPEELMMFLARHWCEDAVR